MRIPSKKAPKKRRVGFTTDEVKILLALPDQKSETGLRDMVLLSFMYATGTRAQEVCDLTVKSVNFRSTGTTIDIVGKGSKARRIRIPDPCASMLRKYIRHRRIETEPDRHIFSSQTHEHMTISCVEEIYKKYIKSTRYFPTCSHNFPKAGEARFQGRSRLFCLLGKFPYLGESRRILMAVSSKTSSKTRFYYAVTRRISSAAVQPSIWA